MQLYPTEIWSIGWATVNAQPPCGAMNLPLGYRLDNDGSWGQQPLETSRKVALQQLKCELWDVLCDSINVFLFEHN